MMRSKFCWMSLWMLLLLLTAPAVRAETVFFEDFAGSTNLWITDGDVAIEGEKAAMRDGDGYSLLYQTIDLSPGYYSIEFDYQIWSIGGPQAYGNGGSFEDYFWANVYFSLVEWTGDELLQIHGPVNPEPGLPESNLQHFHAVFQNPGSQVTPMFEIIGDNYSDGDSLVYLDNIAINALESTPIPEPGTLGFMALGLMGFVMGGRKRLFN